MKLLNLGCGNRFHSEWVNVDFRETGSGVRAHDLLETLPFSDCTFDVVYHSHLLEHFSRDYALVFLQECCRVLKPNGIIRVVVPDLEQIVRVYLDLLGRAIQGGDQASSRYEWILIELFDQMVRNKPGGAMLEYWKQNPMPAEDFVIERVGSEMQEALKVIRSASLSQQPLPSGAPAQFVEPSDPIEIGRFRLSGEIHQWMYDRYSLKILLQGAGFQNIRQCKANESAIPDFNKYLLDIEADGSVRKPDSLFMEAAKP